MARQAVFQDLVLFHSGSDSDRLILLGKRELLDGLARAKLWLADGTFKVVPSLFFQLYTIHFELVSGINSAAVYCLVQNKTQAVQNCTKQNTIHVHVIISVVIKYPSD